MEFLEWWFTEHYILATLFTAKFTLIWAVYKGLVVRGIVAFLLCVLFIMGNVKK